MPQYPGTNPRMTATHSTKDDGGDRDLRVHLVPPCSSRDPRAGGRPMRAHESQRGRAASREGFIDRGLGYITV